VTWYLQPTTRGVTIFVRLTQYQHGVRTKFRCVWVSEVFCVETNCRKIRNFLYGNFPYDVTPHASCEKCKLFSFRPDDDTVFIWRYIVNSRVYFVKGKVSLCLIKHHDLETYGGVEVKFHAFLPSALCVGEWPNFAFQPVSLLEKRPQYALHKRLSGPRFSLDAASNKIISTPTENRTPLVHSVA